MYGFGIQQYGQDNVGSVNQVGNYNAAAIYQYGHRNEGRITQGYDANKANLFQVGSDNFARLDQTSGAEANIRQEGNNNILKGIGGIGDEWTAYSYEGSKLNLDQLGNFNVLNLYQRNGAVANVLLDGNSNVTTVSQTPN